MTEVIFDCDLILGLIGRDVDDGLALLYLPGRSAAAAGRGSARRRGVAQSRQDG